MDLDISQYKNLIDIDDVFKFSKKKKEFSVFCVNDFNDKVVYKILGYIPCNYKKCINYLANQEIRESLSKGSMKCKVIKKVNEKEWFELIVFESKMNLEPLYSIEKVVVEEDIIYNYSMNPENYVDTFIGEKRDNEFSCFKCFDLEKDKCLIVVLLTFDQYELGHDIMVDSTIDFLERLKIALQ